MKTDQGYTEAWDNSYGRSENHLFLPGEEVIRFVSGYLRRRVDVNEIRDVCPNAAGSRVVDVGCGLGRNVLFGSNMGLEMYGNDLSARAIVKVIEWLSPQLGSEISQRLVASDIRNLPWQDGFFNHAISDSVLDSMPFKVAEAGVAEIARVTMSGGYFYCSLISGDETGRDSEYCGEMVVEGNMKKIQFNLTLTVSRSINC